MQPQAVSLSVLGKVLITFSHGIISSWLDWSIDWAHTSGSAGHHTSGSAGDHT